MGVEWKQLKYNLLVYTLNEATNVDWLHYYHRRLRCSAAESDGKTIRFELELVASASAIFGMVREYAIVHGALLLFSTTTISG